MDVHKLCRAVVLAEKVKEVLTSHLVGVGIGVHKVGGIWRSNHVVVEVKTNLVKLLGWQGRDVVVRPDHATLLRAPKGEANLVVESVVAPQGFGNGKQGRDAAAIVVDARAFLHGVEVGAEENNVIGIALFCFQDYLPGFTLLSQHINSKVDVQILPGF